MLWCFKKRNLIYIFLNSNFFYHIHSFLFGRSQTHDIPPCWRPQFLINSGDLSEMPALWSSPAVSDLLPWPQDHTGTFQDIPTILYILYNQHICFSSLCFCIAIINLNNFCLFVCLFGWFYGISTLFESFNAEVSLIKVCTFQDLHIFKNT